jgi:D-alanine-D-alanine ligase
MKVAIFFDEVKPQDILDDRDVMQQVAIVVNSLKALGHQYVLIPCTLNLQAAIDALMQSESDIVFNLLDTLDSKDCLAHLPIEVLDGMLYPHTGPTGQEIAYTTNKFYVRNTLTANGIKVPGSPYGSGMKDDELVIIKAIQADGSYGMHDTSVMTFKQFREDVMLTMDGFFAERYISGREITVPFLNDSVYTPVEIIYVNYPPGKPKILGQEAKWKVGSFEHSHTTSEVMNVLDPAAIEVSEIARQCLEICNLPGWGRIDFRLTENNTPNVIDVNCNCCLAKDAWFMQSMAFEGMNIDNVIKAILEQKQRGVA